MDSYAQRTYLSDFWQLDTVVGNWTQLITQGPSPLGLPVPSTQRRWCCTMPIPNARVFTACAQACNQTAVGRQGMVVQRVRGWAAVLPDPVHSRRAGHSGAGSEQRGQS